jgi:hypothetical protein
MWQSRHWTPCCGPEVQKLTQALKSIKCLGLGNTFDLNLKWARSLPSGILHGIFIEPLSRKFICYRSQHLTPCCGLEMQKPTQALKSVKGLGNTFDINPKWARTLPSGILHGISIEPPHPPHFFFIEVDIWHPAMGLRCRNPPMYLCHAWAIPST